MTRAAGRATAINARSPRAAPTIGNTACAVASRYVFSAGSVALFGMYGSVSDVISIDLANALLFTSFAVTWSGARVFDGRAPQPLYLVGGAALWLLVCRSPWLADSLDAALRGAAGERVYALPTYTALLELRDLRADRGLAKRWSE